MTVSRWLAAFALSCSLEGSPPAVAYAGDTSAYSQTSDFAPGTAPFRETLCLNTKFSQGQPMSELPMLNELGVRWVRDHVHWRDLEPVAGQYQPFPEKLQTRLRFYREHGIGVMFWLGYDNREAYPNTPENPHHSVDAKAFAQYAVQSAKQLRQAGVRFKLEIWNEPHNFVMSKLLGGRWQGKPPSPWVDHYIDMVRQTVAAVHAFDPSIELFTNEDAWVIHYWYLEKGLPADLTGFAVHPYPGKSAAPEITPMTQDVEWARPFQTVDADRSFRSAARRLREQGKHKLGHAPRLWTTETGFKLGGDTLAGRVDEQRSAAFLPRVYVLAAAAGIEGTCWFSARDAKDGPWGLTDNNSVRRPAFTTYAVMARELGDLKLSSQLSGNTHPTRGLQAFVFSGAAGERTIAWNIDEDREYVLTAKAGATVRVRDVYGVERPVRREKEGLVVHIGIEPVYIDGLRNDADAIRPRS